MKKKVIKTIERGDFIIELYEDYTIRISYFEECHYKDEVTLSLLEDFEII